MDYKFENYKADLVDPEMPHSKNKERFQEFYNQLGVCPIQRTQNNPTTDLSFIVLGGMVLELGCHCGYNCIEWARKGVSCTGIDVSETLIEFAREKLSAEPKEVQERVTFIHSFIEDFIPPIQYDTIVLTETLEHVMSPLPVLIKAKECLRPGGLLYISSPSVKTGNNSHIRGISSNTMAELLNSAGLKIVLVQDVAPQVTTYAIATV